MNKSTEVNTPIISKIICIDKNINLKSQKQFKTHIYKYKSILKINFRIIGPKFIWRDI